MALVVPSSLHVFSADASWRMHHVVPCWHISEMTSADVADVGRGLGKLISRCSNASSACLPCADSVLS